MEIPESFTTSCPWSDIHGNRLEGDRSHLKLINRIFIPAFILHNAASNISVTFIYDFQLIMLNIEKSVDNAISRITQHLSCRCCSWLTVCLYGMLSIFRCICLDSSGTNTESVTHALWDLLIL